MSNPTTPFGWQMPTNTDLVTDLPADFEVFGQAVATSMQDLLGGTTGQVLAKASNADMDFVWSADAAGMTNPMTTTGDIIYSSPGSTPVRRAIGTTGQVLTVASGVPSWVTPASAAPTSGSNFISTSQATTSTSYTDLATVGPTVTLTTGTKVLVILSTLMPADSQNGQNRMSFAISGATTLAASDNNALIPSYNSTREDPQCSLARFYTVTAGSNTFTAKYASSNGNSFRFLNRELTVIDLGS